MIGLMIGKSIVWELSLPVNFDTCVDDHVCTKIHVPHFIISCEQSSVEYYLHRTSTNVFNSIVSVCDENKPQHQERITRRVNLRLTYDMP